MKTLKATHGELAFHSIQSIRHKYGEPSWDSLYGRKKK